jgi:hypothetical protein
VGLERDLLSLVRLNEKILERKSSSLVCRARQSEAEQLIMHYLYARKVQGKATTNQRKCGRQPLEVSGRRLRAD